MKRSRTFERKVFSDRMIADQPRATPAIGNPDRTVLNAGAFREKLILFIETELPLWRDRPERPPLTDEPHLNEFLSNHLNSAARRQYFDCVQFSLEPNQVGGRRGDIAIKPLGVIVVEGRTHHDFEQLLPIECKRLPTPRASDRSEVEYVDGLPGSRSGGIERFKLGLHGPANSHALLIGYVQKETFEHWFSIINARLSSLAGAVVDANLWKPVEPLSAGISVRPADVRRLSSIHRRSCPPCASNSVMMDHLWVAMN